MLDAVPVGEHCGAALQWRHGAAAAPQARNAPAPAPPPQPPHAVSINLALARERPLMLAPALPQP